MEINGKHIYVLCCCSDMKNQWESMDEKSYNFNKNVII